MKDLLTALKELPQDHELELTFYWENYDLDELDAESDVDEYGLFDDEYSFIGTVAEFIEWQQDYSVWDVLLEDAMENESLIDFLERNHWKLIQQAEDPETASKVSEKRKHEAFLKSRGIYEDERLKELGDIKIYTLTELEPVLGVTHRTLLTYIKDGKLKGVKIGGKWKVTAENLRKFINGEE